MLRLVTSEICEPQDTVNTLRAMLQAAISGELTGIAAICVQRDSGYSLCATGSARDNTTFTLGALRMLESELVQTVRREAATATG